MSNDFWVGPRAHPDTYRLTSLLGGGGEGEVWRAVLPLSAGGRSTVAVAVKILRSTGYPDEELRWERFGHLLRSLSHPGLVRVTDVFTGPQMHRETGADPNSRSCFVVMDFIDGPTLREWCDEHPDATAAQRLRMLRMVASALDEMHSGAATQVPVAHGDVKPANVVVRDGDGTVLVDVGLTRLTDGAGVAGRSAPYAAPELRAPGAMATPEADRYAFAVTAAQVLTGQPPPTGPDGWLDPDALASLLRAHPVTSRRTLLVRQILDAIEAPPEARPRQLRIWLDSALDTLSSSNLTSYGETTALPSAGVILSTPAQVASVLTPQSVGYFVRRLTPRPANFFRHFIPCRGQWLSISFAALSTILSAAFLASALLSLNISNSATAGIVGAVVLALLVLIVSTTWKFNAAREKFSLFEIGDTELRSLAQGLVADQRLLHDALANGSRDADFD